MHQIDLGVSDVLLPAVVAGPTALKCVESDLADETNDLGPLRANGFQCALYARLLLTSVQFCHVYRGPVHQIHKVQCIFRNELFIVNVSERFITLEVTFNFIQQPGPVEQIPEHLVVGKRHAAPMRTGMRIDAHKKDSRML